MLTIRQQQQRGPGGGKMVRKRVQRKWLYQLAQSQQITINAMAESIYALKEINLKQQRELAFQAAVHTPRAEGKVQAQPEVTA